MPDSGRSKSYSGRYAIEDAARPREVGDVRLALAAAIAASILAPNPEAVTPQATTAEDAQVTITSTTPILTSPDDILTVTATITNTGIAPFVGDINLRKANEPFASLAELEAWATSGVEAEYAAWRVDADTTTKTDSPLQPGETRTVAFHVRTQLLALAPATYPWGPWGLLVDVETERGISLAVDRTFTVYAPPDKIGAPLELTTVAPLVARSGQSLAEAAYGAAEIALATVDAPVDWLLDPRLLGKSRPLDDALTSANRDKTLIALPWGDLDCSTLAHAANDARPLLAVADTLAEEAINTTLAPRIRFDLWWPEDAIDAELVHLTSSLPESPTLLGEPLAVPPDRRTRTMTALTSWPRRVTALAGDASAQVLVPDPWLLTHLFSPAPAGTSQSMAELTMTARVAWYVREAQEAGAPGAVLVLDRDFAPSAALVSSRLETLAALPWITTTSLATLLDRPGESNTEVLAGPDPQRGPTLEDITRLSRAQAQVDAFSAITTNPEQIVDNRREGLIAPFAHAVASLDDRASLARAAITDAKTLVSQVSVVKGSSVTLISQAGELPVAIRNRLDEPVKVRVGLRPLSRALVSQASIPLEIDADSQATARLPIRAIANGTVEVEVVLSTLDGVEVSATSALRVRVHAEWETLWMAAISGFVGVAFTVGLIRSIRRRWRARGSTQ